jgi:RNA polymerase-binding transcription factor DksA
VEEHYETDLAHSARVLDDVDRALERLSQGTYGLCETCRTPILGADLEADPTRRMCEQHLPLRPQGGDAPGGCAPAPSISEH